MANILISDVRMTRTPLCRGKLCPFSEDHCNKDIRIGHQRWQVP